ncbi:MAG: acyl-CoA dehydrogenase family protein, partial [Planctomycetes bacterium]|nr:acyl-CoA dehydrogenase family protein [Planctomycetota bacterium]
MILGTFLLALFAGAGLLFVRRPLTAAAVSWALFLIACFGGPAGLASWWIWVLVLWAIPMIFFGPTPVRRALITPQVFKLIAPILPVMSQTEKDALDAGTVWWDGELFSGAPNWKQLFAFKPRELSTEEQAFLDGPVNEVCSMLTEWEVNQKGDLPPEVWDFLKVNGFFGLIIPKQYGGKGFSAYGHSAIIARLSTRSTVLSVSVMVPNSLGPAELLLHYGTEEQKDHYLPRLADGRDMPALALTAPTAGSDAASMA